ncbi:PspC domain-containing protein [Paenibacillus tarimensis]
MKKLYRSRNDRKLTGICGGLAVYTGVDATLLRILLVVATIFSSGTLLFVYVIAAFIIPKEPLLHNGYGYDGFSTQGSGWSGSHQASTATGFHAQPSGIDSMMDDLEKQALRKEMEQYRARLAQYEKGER